MFLIQVAQDQDQHLIYAADYQQERPLFCPQCHRRVQFVMGDKKRPFFRHLSPKTHFNNESAIHRQGKQWLGAFFRPWGPTEFEVWAPPDQRIDVLVHQKRSLAVEYQCAPIGADELAFRQHSYWKKKFHPVWIFGEKHYQQATKLAHLQRIVSYSPVWEFYVLFKLPQENYLRLHYQYQVRPESRKLYWQQQILSTWEQLQSFRPPTSSRRKLGINWQSWYLDQQVHPDQNFIYWQNYCYRQRLDLKEYIQKTPLQAVFPIYRCPVCYLQLARRAQQPFLASLPLVKSKTILKCANLASRRIGKS
ncbi:hypothetical protein HU830_06490 [Lactobacillus sp. DCY120]|uniref:Competence protein CoiA n=1 Tax=Bombilactobacillus apium TaxID=2675299 RepID=A0A850R7X8_9LACO|nr:competence protein CoiA family protein [Bombilactobacillus apium]NVY96802.1 hypothetical protein [Bombilactobacillus apium]